MSPKIEIILVPTDFSVQSCDAFVWAALLARQFNAKILLLHVISEEAAEDLVSIPGNPWEKVLEKEDKMMIKEFSACVDADLSDNIVKEAIVAVGGASEEIVETAQTRGASLIVMATHGRTGLAHVLLGSVAEQVLRHARCPVLSIRGSESRGL
jgi:universal stress protein A